MAKETNPSHCRHGVRYPHECADCKNAVTEEEIRLHNVIAQSLLPHISGVQNASSIAHIVLDAIREATSPQETSAIEKDAQRYRKIRSMTWNTSRFAVVANPRNPALLGIYTPSGDLLDKELDSLDEPEQVIDLDAQMWGRIKQSASKATWMPPEYTMNDWVSDLCQYLEGGFYSPLTTKAAALFAEFFNTLSHDQKAACPEELAKRVGDFMVSYGYRFVFGKWYKQAEPTAPGGV